MPEASESNPSFRSNNHAFPSAVSHMLMESMEKNLEFAAEFANKEAPA